MGVYNGLVQLRNNNEKAWSNLDVLLQQRHDELTKLVDAVSGYMKHERGALEEITRLRGGYDAARDMILANQLEMGIVPAGTRLSPRDTR